MHGGAWSRWCNVFDSNSDPTTSSRVKTNAEAKGEQSLRRGVVNSPKLQEILSTISILFAKHYKKFLANVQFLNSSVQATLPRTFVLVNYVQGGLEDGSKRLGHARRVKVNQNGCRCINLQSSVSIRRINNSKMLL